MSLSEETTNKAVEAEKENTLKLQKELSELENGLREREKRVFFKSDF